MCSLASVVAIHKTHEQAEVAVRVLQQAGVDMKSLSIVAKDTPTYEHFVGYYNAGDRICTTQAMTDAESEKRSAGNLIAMLHQIQSAYA